MANPVEDKPSKQVNKSSFFIIKVPLEIIVIVVYRVRISGAASYSIAHRMSGKMKINKIVKFSIKMRFKCDLTVY